MHLRTGFLAIALVVTMATLIPSGVNPLASGSSDRDIHISDGTVRIVTTDEDGDRDEAVYRLFGGSGAFLGVRLEDERDDRRGARIERVIEGTAADEAGLRDGDVIVGIDGDDIDDAADLTHRIHDLEPGDRVELEIERDGRSQFNFEGFDGEEFGERMRELGERLGRGFAFEFDGDEDFDSEEFEERMRELGERLGDMKLDIRVPHFEGRHHFSFGGERPKLGVQLVATTPELREHLGGSDDAGVLVSKVLPGMPAESAGVRVGDLIVGVDGDAVKDVGDLIELLADRSGETIELELVRDGRTLRLDVDLEEQDTGRKGDRAGHYRWDGRHSMDVAKRAYAAAMEAQQAVRADALGHATRVNDAVMQYRRAVARSGDLSQTY
jgi:predicted metalloprotease with PDZ domain